MTKLGLQHFDAAGTVLSGPSSAGVNTQASTNTGGLAGALGLANSFQAAGANVQAGTNGAQLNKAYSGNQNAINQQQALANTFNPQAQAALNQQAAVAAQLQQMSQGRGPNPSQAALNQSTGQNLEFPAALMASQRGAGANAGLIARQAAQQGAATQQQAVGQGAVLQAQQQIAAQNALAGLSGQQAAQTQGAAGALTQAQQGEQGILQNANTAYNNNAVTMQSNINTTNAATAQANADENSDLLGGIAKGVGGKLPVVGSLFKAEGGVVGLANGGDVETAPEAGGTAGNPTSRINTGWGRIIMRADGGEIPQHIPSETGPQSYVGQYLTGTETPPSIEPQSMMAKGGESKKVPAMVSPGERYLSPKDVKKVEQGKDPEKLGEKIPGKPKVPGAKNSYANDTIHKVLEAGGIVLPRSTTQAKDKSEKEAEFVKRLLLRKGANSERP